jgi:hypothetical protein
MEHTIPIGATTESQPSKKTFVESMIENELQRPIRLNFDRYYGGSNIHVCEISLSRTAVTNSLTLDLPPDAVMAVTDAALQAMAAKLQKLLNHIEHLRANPEQITFQPPHYHNDPER